MIFISILILIVAIALPSINKNISPLLLTRISSIVFIYAGALSLNALYIQSIGSGIGIYSGLFQITTVSQLIDTFIFFIEALTIKDVKVEISKNLLYLFLIPRSKSKNRNMSSSSPRTNNNKGNENKNDNTNKKKGIKSILNIITPLLGIIVGFILYGDVNHLLVILKSITFRQVLIGYCIIILLIIIDYLIKIYLLVSFRKNKMKLSDYEYLPTFFYKKLEEQELTSKCDLITYRIFLDLYLGEIKTHLFLAILIITLAYLNQYI